MKAPVINTLSNITSVHDFILEHTLGSFTTYYNTALVCLQASYFATQVLGGDSELFAIIPNQELLNTEVDLNNAIFAANIIGPYSYISPSWAGAGTTHNYYYKSVTFNGEVALLTANDANKVYTAFLTMKESKIEPLPTTNNEVPQAITEPQVAFAIVKLNIHKATHNLNLGQELDAVQYSKIIRALKKQDDYASMLLAFEMEQNLKQKIKKV